MFGFLKRNAEATVNPITEVADHLRVMGYDLTPYGAGVALLQVQSGYSAVEAASYIALITMALDIKSGPQAFERLIRIHSHAMALLEVLKEYQNKRMMRETIWKNDSTALFHIANVDQEQMSWIEKVLSDPIASKERLASSRIKYASPTAEDETEPTAR